MFSLTRRETGRVMSGLASGCARKYDGGCPHKPGGEIVLTSKYIDASGQGRSIPFAKVEVVSVRPGTVGEFRMDPVIAEIDGYENGEVWFGQMSQLYRGLKNTDEIYHIKWRVLEIDRQAGRRGDVQG